MLNIYIQVAHYVVQLLSRVWLFETPWTAAHQASLSFTVPEFTQTHLHWVSDAIQPSHPMSLSRDDIQSFHLSFCYPAFKHQDLFQWVESLYQVAKILELQHEYFQRILNWFPLESIGLISLLSQETLPAPKFKNINSSVLFMQFFNASSWSNSHSHTWLLENP